MYAQEGPALAERALRRVAREWDLKPEDLRQTQRRFPELIFVRRIGYWVARRAGAGVTEIGYAFDVDHSTVCVGVSMMDFALSKASALREKLEQLANEIAGRQAATEDRT